MITAALKIAVERGLVAAGTGTLVRRWHRRRVLVLAYHNVVPDKAPPQGDSSLHLPLAQFQTQLDLLCRTLEIVRLGDAMLPADGNGHPRAVVTFDDAYRGAIVLGVAELVRRGLPATVFVAPGFVGRKTFWWDRFCPSSTRGWPPDLRQRLLTELGGNDSAIDEWARAHRLTEAPLDEWHRVATEAELTEAVRHPGIELACHSWSHPNLTTLGPAELAEEIALSMAWLRQRFQPVVPWLAYPYGLRSRQVEDAARAAGLAGGLRGSGGWWPAHAASRFELPRWNVPAGLSTAGFTLRAAGILCR
jgi:peptidoglycan/xylan/chitin deacetylase (PgdA/CDA1 family)